MTQPITSITRGPRQSNFELLRIIAMFMILGLHANVAALGMPDSVDFSIGNITRIVLEFACIVSVNVFVMISGWFRIKPSIKGISTFLFQCFFFLMGGYLVMCALGFVPFSIKGLMSGLAMQVPSNWFIRAYLGLYIIAPLLNLFIEKSSKRTLEIFLIAFYTFQTVYGFVANDTAICHGYSTFSFIGLYMLSAYIHSYVSVNCAKMGGHFAAIYIITVLCNSLGYIVVDYFIDSNMGGYLISYDNPLVVIGAAAMVMWFSKIKIQPNKTINVIAKSAFAAYLFHATPAIVQNIYFPIVNKVYNLTDGLLSLLGIIAIISIFFSVGILLDQPRMWMWQKLSNRF